MNNDLSLDDVLEKSQELSMVIEPEHHQTFISMLHDHDEKSLLIESSESESKESELKDNPDKDQKISIFDLSKLQTDISRLEEIFGKLDIDQNP